MTNLKLQPGEVILLQTSGGCRYNGENETEIDELYLTNKNIIFVCEESKGFFSSKTETHLSKIPLTQIAVVDGAAQVELIKDAEYGKTLQVIYINGDRDLFELYDCPKKQYPVWKAATSEAVLKAIQMTKPVTEENKSLFCTNCGEKLREGARFCSCCGSAVKCRVTSSNSCDSKTMQQCSNKNDSEPQQSDAEAHKKYSFTITEKKYSLRKNYTIHDAQGNILYVAKSEGLPRMPEIVIYKHDEQVGSVEKELFAKPLWGGAQYTLSWHGKEYASLQRKRSLKVIYEVPEKGWKFVVGVMTSKLYDRNDSIIAEIGLVISSSHDRYTVEYSDIKYEPAAVLFALAVAMGHDLEKR